MALVTTTEMFKKAYDGGYAIGAFNVNNMEIVQGITEAARDPGGPLILQVSKRPGLRQPHLSGEAGGGGRHRVPQHPHRPASGPRP